MIAEQRKALQRELRTELLALYDGIADGSKPEQSAEDRLRRIDLELRLSVLAEAIHYAFLLEPSPLDE